MNKFTRETKLRKLREIASSERDGLVMDWMDTPPYDDDEHAAIERDAAIIDEILAEIDATLADGKPPTGGPVLQDVLQRPLSDLEVYRSMDTAWYVCRSYELDCYWLVKSNSNSMVIGSLPDLEQLAKILNLAHADQWERFKSELVGIVEADSYQHDEIPF